MKPSSEPTVWPSLAVENLTPSVLMASFHVCPPPYSPPFRVPGLGVYLIVEGRMRFEMSDGARGIAGPNTLVTFYAGRSHYEVVGRVPLAIYQMAIYAGPEPHERAVPFLEGVGNLPHVIRVGSRMIECAAIFERIMRTLLAPTPTWRVDNAAATLELLSIGFQCVERRRSERPQPLDKWQRMLVRLEEERSQITEVGQLASDMGLSVYQFIRKFQSYTGHTPKQYLLLRHLWNARQMIAKGASVKEAAMETGFKDQCYFSRIYKLQFGHAPTRAPRGVKRGAHPPPLLSGTTPACRHLLAPGVDYGIFHP